MNPLATILGFAVAAAASLPPAMAQRRASAGTPASTSVASPFPRSQPEYQFYGSLASAINAAQGKKKIVVYTVQTMNLRNRLQWLVQQRAIFSHPVTKKVLAGLPMVALRHDMGEGKGLRLPQVGLSILSADGKRVERRIDFSALEYVKVPVVLAECLSREITEVAGAVVDVRAELLAYQTARNKLMSLDEAGAEKLCEAEERRSPDGFGPKLLRHALRARFMSADYYRKLPADRPVLDTVCIVPDFATFLHVVESWGDGPIFPILYLDSHYLPLFVEAFRPKRIFVATRVKPSKLDAVRMFTSYGKAFGGRAVDSESNAVAMWRGHGDHAPGVVFSHPDSPMAAAGLALAAGRRQLLAMLPPANTKRRVSLDHVNRLRSRIRRLFDKHFLAADLLYDDIDYLTLATEQPFRYADRLYSDKTTYAVDDKIARDDFDFPFACVGRMLGGREQSLYMAMCSLFLRPESSLLFSRYPDSGSWAPYGTKRAARLLAGKVAVKHLDRPDATLSNWNKLFGNPTSKFDLVHVNSSGGPRNWTTTRGSGSFDDIPLTGPAIVSYVHSNSLGDGYDSDTVGGRWLHNGAYFFFGSTHEPYLDAFVNIYAVYRRAIEAGQPLGMAQRLLPLQLRWRPWKLMLFGDPMLRLQFQEPERLTDLPKIWGVTTLHETTKRNPFGLEGTAREVFDAQCLALAGDRGGVDSALAPSELRHATADLVAWSSLRPDGTARLRQWIPHLRAAHIDSRRLSYVAHTLFVRHAAAIRQNPLIRGASQDIQALAVQHTAFDFSPLMYQRIGKLYRTVLNKMPNPKHLKTAIKTAAKNHARHPNAIRPFLRAL
jgi:hypothetical protein